MTRSRRLNIFPRLTDEGIHDTLIASTIRWLLYVGGTVTRRLFMTEYHARSSRTTTSRSSFVNNVGPYTRGDGHVLGLVDPEGRRLNVYGNYDCRTSHPANAPHPNHRTGVFLRWVGPSIETWLGSMLDRDLDRAFQALERQLLDLGAKTIEWQSYHNTLSESPWFNKRAEETAWWLTNVRGEINRRATGEAFVVVPSGVTPPVPTKKSRQQCYVCRFTTTTRPSGICIKCYRENLREEIAEARAS